MNKGRQEWQIASRIPFPCVFGHSSIGFFLRSFAALLEEESIAKRADFEIVILCTDR